MVSTTQQAANQAPNPHRRPLRLADSASPVGRNITYNLTGYMVPLAAALVATPFLIRGYGAERFGVLTLAWALVSYAGVLDLGTGRALIKLVAEHRAAGKNDSLGRLLGTASWLLFGFGFASGVLLFIGAEPLVEHVLRVSPTLRAETARGIQILAVSVPVVMLAVGCRSLLEGLDPKQANPDRYFEPLRRPTTRGRTATVRRPRPGLAPRS